MLIYADKRYIPTDLNMMVIQDSAEKYYYIHRLLYDQAVILEDKFGAEPSNLCQIIAGPQGQYTRNDVTLFLEKAPKPIRILGCFLLLCDTEFESLEDMAGAIHVMSGPLNFYKMIQTPYEMRSSIRYNMNIKNEYKLAWDRFFQTVIEYRDDMFFQNAKPMNGTATVTSSVPINEEGEEVEVAEEEEEQDPMEYLMNVSVEDFLADLKGDEEEDTEDTETSETTSTTEETEEVKEEPVEEEPVEEYTEPGKEGLNVLAGIL